MYGWEQSLNQYEIWNAIPDSKHVIHKYTTAKSAEFKIHSQRK